MAIRPNPTQVLAGGGIAFFLALLFFAVVSLRWEYLFKAHPLLALPFVLSMVSGPASLFISIRRITELGLKKRLVFSTLLSVAAIGLTVLTFQFSLWHLAGG